MKVTMKDDYLEIEKNEDEPKLCIDARIAGIILYELFDQGIENLEEWGDNVIKLLDELKDD